MTEQFDYSKKPWELNQDLTEGILNAIAKVIEQKTKECLEERFDTSRGDSHYSYGHTARAWRIFGLRELIASQIFPNIKILKDKGNSFEFAIGKTLMKIYSGIPEEMTANMKKLSPYEAGQYSLKLEGSDNDEIYWRIMINSAPTTHDLLNISFTGFNKYEELVCVYAPLEQIPVIYSVDKVEKEAKKIPDATFSRKKTTQNSEAI